MKFFFFILIFLFDKFIEIDIEISDCLEPKEERHFYNCPGSGHNRGCGSSGN
jgi:hypothetical protein